MIEILSIFLPFFILVSAITVLYTEDLLICIAVLGAFSFFSAGYFAVLGALDVALTEAIVGGVITTVLFVLALYFIERRTTP